MRGSGVLLVLLSVLLGMSLGGCKGGQKANPPEKPPVGGGGGGGGGAGAELELSERAKEFSKLSERVNAGEAVDFIGDGSTYRRWTENGVSYSQTRTPEDKVRSTFEKRDGYEKDTYSAYADGVIDSQTERTPGREVQLRDRARRGFFDERLTLIFIPETGMIHRTLEKRNSAAEAWAVIEQGEVPPLGGYPKIKKKDLSERANILQAPSKAVELEGIAGSYTIDLGNGLVLRYAGYNVFVQGAGAGEIVGGNAQCDLGDTIKIRDALESVINNVQRCLAATNKKASDKLQDVLVEHTPTREVLVDCELKDWSPHSAMADTDRTPGWDKCKRGTPCRISFNKNDLKEMSPSQTEALLLHELLHVSGTDADPATHDNGDDEIYACARYCSGCSEEFPHAPEHSNTDCTRCASTPDQKLACGFKLIYGPGPLKDMLCGCARVDDYGLCPGHYATCTQVYTAQRRFCDDTFHSYTYGLHYDSCCNECANAVENSSDSWNTMCKNLLDNWDELKSTPYLDNCDQPPPFCQ